MLKYNHVNACLFVHQLTAHFCQFIFRPGYTKTVKGEGMPVTNDKTRLGDLVIAFDIQFPTHLSPEQKDLLAKALNVR